MKRILVTGGTGFIGNYVICELLKRDFKVIATSLNPEKASKQIWFKNVEYIPFDIAKADYNINYFEYFRKPDSLIHLAWEGLPNYNQKFHLTENLPRHTLFLKNIVENGLKDITVVGTCLEYGLQNGCIREDSTPMPVTFYGEAKNNLRIFIEELKKENNFCFKWLRLFYMYGEGQNQNSLFAQLKKALDNNEEVFNMSGGEQVRDYLSVECMVNRIVKVATQCKTEGIINCCSGKPVKIIDMVRKFIAESGKEIKLNLGYYNYPDYEPMEFWGDVEKLNSAIKTNF